MERSRVSRIVWGAFLVALTLGSTSCDDCWEGDCFDPGPCGGGVPAVPVGVVSETGDQAVRISWIAGQDPDLRNYRVYVSVNSEGPFVRIGESYGTEFVDHDVRNGTTYYYAVSAVNQCGVESPLSLDDVFDTPRPEGWDLELTRASERPATAGYDFSTYRRQHPGSRGTDIVFDWINGVPYILAASPEVGLQDIGFLEMAALNYAPAEGWVRSGRVEVTEGHTYAVLTGDGYFAKFRVTAWDDRSVLLDWAFQVARGNRELSVEAPLDTAGSSGNGAGSRVKEATATAVVSEGGVAS